MNNLLPIITFFITYKLYGLQIATISLLGISVGLLIIAKITKGKVDKHQLISTALILVFGSATLLLNDDIFIKWKLSVTYWLMSLTLIITQLFTSKPLIKRLAESSVSMDDNSWSIINLSWALFTFIMGFVNIYIAYNYNTNTWVNFKLFGTTAMSFIFIALQILFVVKTNKATLVDENKLPNTSK